MLELFKNKISIFKSIRTIKDNSVKLKKLLDVLDIVEHKDNTTILKFKGNLVIYNEGSTVIKGTENVVLLGENIHLNPDVKFENIENIDEMDKELKLLREDSLS